MALIFRSLQVICGMTSRPSSLFTLQAKRALSILATAIGQSAMVSVSTPAVCKRLALSINPDKSAFLGDPIPNAQRNEVSSVYQFNSRKLAAYIDSLNAEVFDEGYKIYGALNVNARNFEVELRRAEQKIEHGMVGFLTQPVLTQEAVENLAKARERLSAKILGGIIPVVSEKNARFMDSEVNGIRVSEEIISQYVGKNREEGEQLAVEISLDMAKKIKPYIDGYYLITPFNRVALMEKIIEGLRE